MKRAEGSIKPLTDLQLLLSHVFVPLEGKPELKSTMQKFASQLHHTVSQVFGSTNIPLPPVPLDLPVMDIITQHGPVLETTMEEWTRIVKDMIAKTAGMKVETTSAMAEIDFWRNKSAMLSALHQQFSLPKVKRIIEVMEVGKNRAV